MPTKYKHKESTLALARLIEYMWALRVVKNPKRMRQMWERTKRSIGE